MIPKPLDAITASDLQALVDERVSEDLTIDYKRELNRSKDADKKEFLADVSSFANARGGDIIFGIDEDDGVPTAIVGIPGLSDSDIVGCESSVQSGLRPKIPDVRFRSIDTHTGKVLVCRITDSWASP